MSLTLYDIDFALIEASEALNGVFDEETGEVIDIDVFEALKAEIDNLQMEREKKIHNVACWIKNIKAEAEAVKTEKQKLAKRQAVLERKADNLKKYLEYALHGEKFKDGAVSISYRTTKSVVFYDDFDYSTLPEEYQKVTIEPKKTELKQAIENGQIIEGVELEVKSAIQIK